MVKNIQSGKTGVPVFQEPLPRGRRIVDVIKFAEIFSVARHTKASFVMNEGRRVAGPRRQVG